MGKPAVHAVMLQPTSCLVLCDVQTATWAGLMHVVLQNEPAVHAMLLVATECCC